MSLILSAPIRTALVNDAIIAGLVGEWENEPAVFTRSPVPGDVPFPMIMVPFDAAYVNVGALNSERPNVTRDIFIYGDQPDHYRAVETIAYRVRDLFDRNRFSISVEGYNIVLITATGPIPAPTDDEKSVGRVVTLNILAQRA